MALLYFPIAATAVALAAGAQTLPLDVQAAPDAPAPIIVAQADLAPARAEPETAPADAPQQAQNGAPTDPESASDAEPDSAIDKPEQPLVFADKSDAEVVDMVRAYIESIKVLTGDFGQIAPSGSVSTGKFYLRRPNQLRFEYAPPTPLLIVATQGNVYVQDKDLETTDFYPIKKTPLRFLLSKKVDLADAQIIGVDRGVDTVAVTFASNEGETEGELSLILRAPDFALEQWVVRDLQNGVTVVTLSNQKEDEKLSGRLFTAPDAGGKFLKN